MTLDQLQLYVVSGRTTRAGRLPAPALTCQDGFVISVQANEHAYSTPRHVQGPYTHFELGYPNRPDPLIQKYAEDPTDLTGTVYGYVPAELVLELLQRHGGVADAYTATLT